MSRMILQLVTGLLTYRFLGHLHFKNKNKKKLILPPSYCFVETGSSSFSWYALVCEYLGIITLPYLVLQICFVLSYAHFGPPTLSYFYKQSP